VNPSQRGHSVSVAGIVIDGQGRALLVRRHDNGHWEPPGGVLELDETVVDGVRREVREETGLDVEVEALTGVYKNMGRGVIALVFRCHATSGTLHPTDETSDFVWADPGQLDDLLSEAYAVRVTDALDRARHPCVREHDGVHLLPAPSGVYHPSWHGGDPVGPPRIAK
jgi:ADP-ribose pyrophosphatase YjhB (NUDIX family)